MEEGVAGHEEADDALVSLLVACGQLHGRGLPTSDDAAQDLLREFRLARAFNRAVQQVERPVTVNRGGHKGGQKEAIEVLAVRVAGEGEVTDKLREGAVNLSVVPDRDEGAKLRRHVIVVTVGQVEARLAEGEVRRERRVRDQGVKLANAGSAGCGGN